MTLNVYFGQKLAGRLFSTDNRGVIFQYDETYLSDPQSKPLSLSLPLQKAEYSQAKCLPFFAGLLPEGESRRKIAQYFQVSENSTIKLLEILGGECAGLISVVSEDEDAAAPNNYRINESNYQVLSENDLELMIKQLPQKPLIKSNNKLRLSLAGAQEKIALARFDNKWHLPINGAPSTHILKPTRDGELSSLAQNEYICMRLAKMLGLPVPDIDLINIADKDIFVVSRYDRIQTDTEIMRLHQEDFCQALGVMNDLKYENDGGPSIADIYSCIRANMTIPIIDCRQFLRQIIFNFLIGNCDAHSKNYSVLYDKKTKLAPLYDAVSTAIYPDLTSKLSMKIGNHYELDKIDKEDFILMSQKIDIAPNVIFDIAADLGKHFEQAVTSLQNDDKADNNLLDKICSGISSRLNVI
ncbi:MAG: type II toxin-antitoxin system HipA family toxin [Spirochaetales bacterium]|nr:type II toxin-antitoxin system HipA family toxin [Spirochaetales bacterium]